MTPKPAGRLSPDLTGMTLGRFVIRARLGQGGMGEVYLADDTGLKRPVALKRISGGSRADERYRRRLWKEAQLASQLADPHIAAVFDVMEEEDELFVVMEYVEGQTLRRRLDRPLAIDEFLPIASQCVDALVAAHKAGILHGDVKPENIMLTPAGQVKILDFGIAHRLAPGDETTALALELPGTTAASEIETLEKGNLAGTLPYMAPELLEGKEPDARADIFSLGVVFYEALAGHNPFRARAFPVTYERVLHHDPPPLREVNLSVPAELDRIVAKMLAKAPAERYSSAADLAVDLMAFQRALSSPPTPPADREKVSSWPRSRRVAVVAGLACAAIAGFLIYYGLHPKRVFAERDWMLVTDFENRSGQPLFDETVSESLRDVLQQSRYVNVVPRSQAVEAASRTGRAGVTHLDENLGKEICQRENYRALLAGVIEKSAAGFQIKVRVVDPWKGEPVFTESAPLRSPEELYGAVDGLANRLRAHLGESLAQIEKESKPLARVTTPSLEALQRYSRAMTFYVATDYEHFIPLAKSAIELDPGFAMAHLYLARAYDWRGDEASAGKEMALARQNLDRVTERERYLILAADYSFQGLYEKAADQYRLLTELYPDDLEGYRGLAETSPWAGRAEEGLAAEKRAIKLDPNSAADRSSLILYLDRNNRFSEALSEFQAAQAKQTRSSRLHWGAGLAYLGQGNTQAARQEFELLRREGDPNENNLARLCLARVLIYEGRLREATESLRAGLVLSEKLHSETWIPVQRYLLAQVLLVRGNVAEARAEARRLTAASTDPLPEHELRRSGLMAVQLGDLNTARQRLRRLGELSAQRDSGYTHSCYYNLKGAVDLATGDAASSVESQQRAALFFASYETPSALGNTYAARKEWKSAAEAYQRYLEFKGEIIGNDSPAEWVLAHLTLARVLAKAGERNQALRFYDEFLRLWAHADPDLRALQEARVEREKLIAMIGVSEGQEKSFPGNR